MAIRCWIFISIFFSQTYDSWKDKWLRFQENFPEFSWLQELRESLPDLSNTFAGGKYSLHDGHMKLYIHALVDPGEGPTASLIFGPKLKLKGKDTLKTFVFCLRVSLLHL